MNKQYISPDAVALELYPADGVLNNASNEGYAVDPVDPGFVMEPDFFNLF